jgi:hypothetical protein
MGCTESHLSRQLEGTIGLTKQSTQHHVMHSSLTCLLNPSRLTFCCCIPPHPANKESWDTHMIHINYWTTWVCRNEVFLTYLAFLDWLKDQIPSPATKYEFYFRSFEQLLNSGQKKLNDWRATLIGIQFTMEVILRILLVIY